MSLADNPDPENLSFAANLVLTAIIVGVIA